ncbi:MAG: type II toxin-antitoxin system HicA family toxin [Planctomycetes bacterium]|nr:type II toxin-antitoxin system HicA family toxin [Planctomycetota bacterium]
MSKLPTISGRKCVKALAKVGFKLKRQQGSHMILRRDEPFSQVVVPDHKQLDRGTLRAIVRHAGLSVQDFLALL